VGYFGQIASALLGRGDDETKAARRPPPIGGGVGGMVSYFFAPPGDPDGGVDWSPWLQRIDHNGVVSIALRWLASNATQPELRVGTLADDGTYELAEDHPLLDRWARPNRDQAPSAFLGGIVRDTARGNAILIKARPARSGALASDNELWYVPWRMVHAEPNRVLPGVEYYELRNGTSGPAPRYRPEDVVHVRLGIDPERPWLGLDPLADHARSAALYDRGEAYNAGITRDGGPAYALMPRATAEDVEMGRLPDESMLKAQANILRRHAPGRGGGIPVLNQPLDRLDLGNGPEELMIGELLDRAEALLCAAMGLNPLVLNLPSSSNTRTYSNLAEAFRHAWEAGLQPLMTAIAEAVQHQLLPDYGTAADRCWWDYSQVDALNEAAESKTNRATQLWTSGLATMGQACDLAGLPTPGGPEADMRIGDAAGDQADEGNPSDNPSDNLPDDAVADEGKGP
jgi:phage portal protein BeeE